MTGGSGCAPAAAAGAGGCCCASALVIEATAIRQPTATLQVALPSNAPLFSLDMMCGRKDLGVFNAPMTDAPMTAPRSVIRKIANRVAREQIVA